MPTGLQRASLAEGAPVVGRLAVVVVSISLVACVTRPAAGPTATAPAATTAPVAPTAAPATASPAAAPTGSCGDCMLRVIVSFAESGAKSPPNSTLLQDISRAARVELTYVRSLTPALHVLVLRARDDGDCERALGRLRSDPRVRSADIDARRQPHR